MRVCFLLYFEHSLRQRVDGLVVEHGDWLLTNDGAVIVLVIDKVNGAAGYFYAGVQHSLMYAVAVHSVSAKRWNERRMNVYDAAGEVIRQRSKLHEARHGYVIDPSVATRREHFVAE